MVRLSPSDVQTKEVLDYKGLHLFHCQPSSSAQKIRAYFILKDISWTSHTVEIMANEHLTPYFLGINPRGTLPVLVHDGVVHIESNDILLHLEDHFCDTSPRLLPRGMDREELVERLEGEEKLHHDLRRLSLRWFFAPLGLTKSPEVLKTYSESGSNTIHGQEDNGRRIELDFWAEYNRDNGTSDVMARKSARAFKQWFDHLDKGLEKQRFMGGDELSILDVSFIVSAQRLYLSGYPMEELHPHLEDWRKRMMGNPAFVKELTPPPPLEQHTKEVHAKMRERHQTLKEVCFADL